MIISFILGAIVGAVVAMRYAPKLKYTNGKITFEWSDQKKKPS